MIAAPATAPGIAALAIIRVSGKGCIEACAPLFKGSRLSDAPSHKAIYGHWQDKSGTLLDEVIATLFRAPKSFTGEDSIELSCHGSPYIVKEILRSLWEIGIRPAEAGEFSRRAFLNGRLDLTEAEAVRDLIHAQSRWAHRQALGRLEGGLSSKVQSLHENTLDLLALLETAIDHSEEELDLDNNTRLQEHCQKLIAQIEALLKGARAGIFSAEGVKIALVGKPNTGKSSLLNALCGEDRAIVSDRAGTTRDVIEQSVQAEGLMLRFFDTAGIRDSADPIEQEGTRRSRKILSEADLVLWVRDGSLPLDALDEEIQKLIPGGECLLINNKSDRGKVLPEGIPLSAKTGEGIPLLFARIKGFVLSGGGDPEQDILVSNVRQEGLLSKAHGELNQALLCLARGDSEEFPAAHVRRARLWIEEISGRTTDDAVLDRIFSRFCIGK